MDYREIPQNIHREQRDAQRLLTDALTAFRAAIDPDDVSQLTRQFFAGALNAACAHRRWNQMATLTGSPDEAFVAFTGRIRTLLGSWVDYHPNVIAWCKENPNLFESVVAAQLQRRNAIALPDALTTYAQRSSGGEPKIITLSKLYGQSSYTEAAETAAAALFGDYLASDPGSIRFCARASCRKPFFPARSDKVFHNSECARAVSSNRTHENDQRGANRDKLHAYAVRLARWMKRPEGDWQKALERDTRKRRLLSECINAAQANGPETKRLLIERCFDGRLLSSQELEREIDSLLFDIRKAIDLQNAREENR